MDRLEGGICYGEDGGEERPADAVAEGYEDFSMKRGRLFRSYFFGNLERWKGKGAREAVVWN